MKLSPEAKEFIRKTKKPFTKRRRGSQMTFSNTTTSPEPQRPVTPAPIRQTRVFSAVTSSSRRSVYRVSKLHPSPGSMVSIHTDRCEIDNHVDTCCLGKNVYP